VIGVLTAACALAVPATAVAGGWATVEMSSTPAGTDPGEPWVVDLRILQHARTPLSGLEPSITVTSRESGETRAATARPAGSPGVYRARVVFPAAGTWDYVIDDGFTQRHTYPAVRIGDATTAAAGAGTPASDDETPWLPLAVAGVAALVLLGLVGAMVRQGRYSPSPRRASATSSGSPRRAPPAPRTRP
jgi:hypothetical protein